MRPKPGLGARAIPSAVSSIDLFNEKDAPLQSLPIITPYAPRYRYQVLPGIFRERYIFSDLIFVYATPDALSCFLKLYPYQLFHVHDKSKHADTNTDEYGNLTHDTYMRLTSRAIDDLRTSIDAYHDEVRIFTAHELHQLKYTRKVLIVDGPLKGRTCRIKSIEGKHRVIIDLLEGALSIVVVMPTTHFQRI